MTNDDFVTSCFQSFCLLPGEVTMYWMCVCLQNSVCHQLKPPHIQGHAFLK